MVKLTNGYLITSASELPDWKPEKVFLDVETKRVFDGTYPFKGDRICGFAVSVDDDPRIFYVPLRHTSGNVDITATQCWLNDLFKSAKQWINHNVTRFDAPFIHFENVNFTCELVDTLTLAKVHDSDRIGHGLKELARDWLNLPMSEEAELKQYWKKIDHSLVPVDIEANYACMDVYANRKLYEYLVEHRPEQLKRTWETEIKLASILYDMQMEGLQIDPLECKLDSIKCLKNQIRLTTEISEIAEREFVNSNKCIYDILINNFGLPILARTEKHGAAFDRDALSLYKVHPQVVSSPELTKLIDLIFEYRLDSQHDGLFLKPFLELHDQNNCIHPQYNAVVRTGRMSCSRPNAQQQNKRSKSLIHPKEGYGFLSFDYDQIEFRLIVHYINDLDAIKAYNENPNTDFHKWVADLMHIKRSPGKTLNFGMAYGAGKARATAELVNNPDIIAEITPLVLGAENQNKKFNDLCYMRASELYQQYHERFPGIKSTAYEAASVCKRRGFVFNAYGRRRHLPSKAAYKAFNSIIQGSAEDIKKERMIAISPRYNEKSRAMGLRIAATVHDELLFELPLDQLNNTEYVRDVLQSPEIPLKVPITASSGISTNSWAEASERQ